jgi:hypothetical protein
VIERVYETSHHQMTAAIIRGKTVEFTSLKLLALTFS